MVDRKPSSYGNDRGEALVRSTLRLPDDGTGRARPLSVVFDMRSWL